ncbi:DUF3791 domain-containing protein [Sporofaciens musculi]|uniref:DUF3791 domain-containing protein n=1 Tax=Sporofaciens musculi TaxID=2681861 RepID=UPI0025A09E9A|nr:DUF3791 domain-containing protein [Sporofaciens musculi]
MTTEQEFFLYLLEYYAIYKNRPTGEVLEKWNTLNISEFIFNMYEMYHSEAIENAFKDIDSLIMTGKPAW